MVISLHKLIPLIALGVITNHSKDAINSRLAALNFSPKQFVVKQSMKNILYSIQLRHVGDSTITFEPNIPSYIRQIANSDAGDPARDPWGTFYKLYQQGSGVFIVSAGPDKTFASQDDIIRKTDLTNY